MAEPGGGDQINGGSGGDDGPTRCRQCGLSSIFTTHMRSGPEGKRTLCNACGIAWRKGKQRKIAAHDPTPPQPHPPETSNPNSNPNSNSDSKSIPEIGMEFENEDRAYQFYNRYAGTTGFSIRKGWLGKNSAKIIRTLTLVCSREGFKKDKKKGFKEVRYRKPETRIGCPARLTVKLIRNPNESNGSSNGSYRVTDFVPEHNHPLAPASAMHLLRSQRVLANGSGSAGPDPFDELAKFTRNIKFFPSSYRIALRSKRMNNMQKGDGEAIMNYIQSMKLNDPSFFSAVQLDEDNKLTNIFWTDGKLIENFNYFGDVICLDTSYGSNGYGRPFVPFLGLNHHRQIIIFGGAFLYDETEDSFAWLLETFKIAMNGKLPETLLTDRVMEISSAVGSVWPNVLHRFCTWQVYQNALKSISSAFLNKNFAKDFGKCLYEVLNEHEFLNYWRELLEKYNLVRNNDWVSELFVEREKWAPVYNRHIFCGDLSNVLRNSSLSSVLKKYLNPQLDLLSFFKHFEQILDEYSFVELQSDFKMSQTAERVPPSKMLKQAVNLYTPSVFEIFKKEFEVFLDCLCYEISQQGLVWEYKIVEGAKRKEYFASVDESDWSVCCSCGKFEFVGVQCGHVLKVLDVRNVKELSEKYFLKRWLRDAKLQDDG
ncbi:hypothetical protein LUZ60_010119 [Juncus effusus]|nr:hypothetical protein LUZ60_010119 [Juncus effusus]